MNVQIHKDSSLREIIALIRTDEYAIDLVKEVYEKSKDVLFTHEISEQTVEAV